MEPDGARAPEPAPIQELLSPAEQRFERWRRTLGLFAGPIAFALMLAFPPEALEPAAAKLAAVVVWVLVWWITEPVPIPVTALFGPTLAVLLGVGSAKEMFADFGNPILFLFLGGFLIAEAMVVHGLHRRIAYGLLASRLVAGRPVRVLIAFCLLSAGLSMWISNTAATAVLYPIALGALATLRGPEGSLTPGRLHGAARSLLLACAYGASVGGLGTPIGTPPNLIAMGQIEELLGTRISFFTWMVLAVPLVVVMLLYAVVYLRARLPQVPVESGRTAGLIAAEQAALGRLKRGEANVLVAFALAVVLWLLPGLTALFLGSDAELALHLDRILPEGGVALLAASLLFVLPVHWGERRFTLAWSDAARIDWGTLMLFGGGLSLGAAMFRTGLSDAVGQALTSATGATSLVALTYVFGVFAIYFTEVTSNTATATMLVPLAIAAAQSAGVDPIPPAIACAAGCSMAFMLPVATPPNAVVYGSGQLRVTEMVRSGFWMNAAAAVLVPGGVLLMCRLVEL
jgi:sodium-dependent dicarboxylate transporter 2/3/5